MAEALSVEVEDTRLVCRKCGERFKLVWPVQRRNHLCQECIWKLPRCSSCHIVLAPKLGFMMDVMKYGKVLVCGWCYRELVAKEGKVKKEGSMINRKRVKALSRHK